MTDNATPEQAKVERGSAYEAGTYLFNDLRAFLATAGVDAPKCKLTLTLPDAAARNNLVVKLKADAPKGTEWGISGAQAGNFGGKWQGVEYEWSLAAALSTDDERLREALRPFAEAAHWMNPDGYPDDAKPDPTMSPTYGDYRRAAAALAPTKEG